jgi:hypothetical protein
MFAPLLGGGAVADELVGNWIGDLRGTDVASVFATISRVNGVHRIEVKLNIAGEITDLVGDLEGEAAGAALTLTLADPAQAATGVARSVKAVFDTVTGGRLAGTWTASNGHAGVVGLSKFPATQVAPVQPVSGTPTQPPAALIAREGQLANLVLYRNELEVIVGKVKELVGGKNDVVIAATVDGRQLRQFSKDFFDRKDLPLYVSNVNLSVNDGR